MMKMSHTLWILHQKYPKMKTIFSSFEIVTISSLFFHFAKIGRHYLLFPKERDGVQSKLYFVGQSNGSNGSKSG